MHPSVLLTSLPLVISTQALSIPEKRAEPARLIKAEEGRAIAGKYIVKLKQSSTSVREYAQGIFSGSSDYIYGRFNGFARSLTEAEVNKLRSDPAVEYIEEDRLATGYGIIEQKQAPWGLGRISHREPGAKDYVYDDSAGEGTCVYVLDTGVEDTHPGFGGRAKQIKSFIPKQSKDGHGHGTHVAGIIGSTKHGVAKKTRIYGVKVLNDTNQGEVSSIIAGMEYIEDDKEKRRCPKGVFVNLSGGTEYSEALNDAADALVDTGVFFGAAAGNTGEDAAKFSPASEPSVCTVGGTDPDDKLFYKTYDGLNKPFASNWGPAVNILAPGQGIASTGNGGGEKVMTGSSQATAFVVGLAAYLGSLENLSGTKKLCERIRSLATPAVKERRGGTTDLLAFNGVSVNAGEAQKKKPDTSGPNRPTDVETHKEKADASRRIAEDGHCDAKDQECKGFGSQTGTLDETQNQNHVDEGVLKHLRDGDFRDLDCAAVLAAVLKQYGLTQVDTKDGTNDCERARAMVTPKSRNRPEVGEDTQAPPPPAGLPCSSIEKLEIHFQLSSGVGEGTYDAIMVTFTPNLTTFKTGELRHGKSSDKLVWLAGKAYRGEQINTPVDLKKYFGSDIVAIQDIKYIGIFDGSCPQGICGDAWGLKGLKLKGKCSDSTAQVEVDKYQAVNEELQHSNRNKAPWYEDFIRAVPLFPTPRSSGYSSDELVWERNITVNDWHEADGSTRKLPGKDKF
ncbi:hypothetical protein CDD83_3886 [Cordyceps sp. RAO-2017]|nr:hypothetical protein CDD83_3886 [Cordyceps sp. RAO-2017]